MAEFTDDQLRRTVTMVPMYSDDTEHAYGIRIARAALALKGAPADDAKPPIKSGWRGNLNGYVENTDSHIEVSEVTLRLDKHTAWALANVLSEDALDRSCAINKQQRPGLVELGAALGRLIDNPSANNGGRSIVK